MSLITLFPRRGWPRYAEMVRTRGLLPLALGPSGGICMPDKSNSRGRAFEDKVLKLLLALQARFPARVRVSYQPKLALYDGRTVIPDLELQYDLSPSTHCVLIECQSRKRILSPIVDKVRSIKDLSDRNRFWFVYPQKLPGATGEALKKSGVTAMPFSEFRRYISLLSVTLTHTEHISTSKFIVEKKSA